MRGVQQEQQLPMSSPRTMYKMRAKSVIDLTPTVREVWIETVEPDQFSFQAGQFVTLHVPQEPKPALRAYSIASDDRQKNGFLLLFKKVENGVASNFIWGLKGGEILNFTGPFGRVFFKEPPTKQIVFLNTGTGISQHLSYLISKASRFPEVRYRMLFGVRNESDMYYQEEMNRLTEQLPDFKWEFVLSRPADSWKGKKGYVQNFIEEYDYKNLETTFYLCGNGGMIKETKHHLIEANGFDKTRIMSEAFN